MSAPAEVLEDHEAWRQSMFRSLRRLWLFAIAAELLVAGTLVWYHSWANLPLVIMSMGMLSWSRWMISDRGQRWIKMLRGPQ